MRFSTVTKRATVAFLVCCLFLMLFSSCARKQEIENATTQTTPVQTTQEQNSDAPLETASFSESASAQSPEDRLTAAQIESADAAAHRYNATAVQAAVIKRGGYAASYCYGTANLDTGAAVTEDTKFRIASLSKFVTDTVFMAMADAGLVSEREDISRYLGYTVRNPYAPEIPITPEMLMTHTSSIIDGTQFIEARNYGGYSMQTLLTSDAQFADREPGSGYAYCNLGVAVIGAICETVAGKSFEALASQYVFNPLQIDAAYTASHLQEPSLLAVLYGSGGFSIEQQMRLKFADELGQTVDLVQGNLTISAKDYARILASVVRSAITGERGILSPESARTMLRAHYDRDGMQIGYGQMIQTTVRQGIPLCTHDGLNYGMRSAFAFDPQTGDGVVVFSSGASDEEHTASKFDMICFDTVHALWPEQ